MTDRDKLKSIIFSPDKTTLQIMYASKQIDMETAISILKEGYLQHFEDSVTDVMYYEDIECGNGFAGRDMTEYEYNECTVKSLLDDNRRYNKSRYAEVNLLSSTLKVQTIEMKQRYTSGKKLRISYHNTTWFGNTRRECCLPYSEFTNCIFNSYFYILHQVLNEITNETRTN